MVADMGAVRTGEIDILAALGRNDLDSRPDRSTFCLLGTGATHANLDCRDQALSEPREPFTISPSSLMKVPISGLGKTLRVLISVPMGHGFIRPTKRITRYR